MLFHDINISTRWYFCAGNWPVPGEFPTQRPVTRSFGVHFDLRLNKRLSKQLWGWWFETPSRLLWRHRNENCLGCVLFWCWMLLFRFEIWKCFLLMASVLDKMLKMEIILMWIDWDCQYSICKCLTVAITHYVSSSVSLSFVSYFIMLWKFSTTRLYHMSTNVIH